MKLQRLIDSIRSDTHLTVSNREITGISSHSAKVQYGNLFVAIPGLTVDGHDYIDSAIRSGAVAVVGEKPRPSVAVPYFRVPNARLALAQLASQFYGYPADRHTIVGITGTNGKTTTAYLLRHIFETAGTPCALFGTVTNIVNGELLPSESTTPDAVQLQKWLQDSRDPVVVMEVSSHGLQQERVSGTGFDYAIFTNLSHEHLDYHRNLYEYFQVKASLFKRLKSGGEAVVNSHCEWGKRLIDLLMTEQMTVSTYGENLIDRVQLLGIDDGCHSVFRIREGTNEYTVRLSVPGLHNVWNAMAAFLTARRMGVDASTIQRALRSFPGVPGRFEQYDHPLGARFIVDYAHTPDGLRHCLRTAKACEARRLVHIFGFRGNRDVSKRKEMVRISANLSDRVILTLDDLNSVKTEDMLRQLKKLGDSYGSGKCIVIEDRTKAIQHVWQEAKEGDRVVITGKGPECYQQTFALPCQTDQKTILYLMKQGVSR